MTQKYRWMKVPVTGLDITAKGQDRTFRMSFNNGKIYEITEVMPKPSKRKKSK